MKQRKHVDIDAAMRDPETVLNALRRAQLAAARRHKAAGLPLLVWRDGRIVELSPDEVIARGEEQARGAGGVRYARGPLARG